MTWAGTSDGTFEWAVRGEREGEGASSGDMEGGGGRTRINRIARLVRLGGSVSSLVDRDRIDLCRALSVIRIIEFTR